MLRHHRDIGTKVSGSRNNKLQPPGEGNAGHPVASRCSQNPLSRPACLLPTWTSPFMEKGAQLRPIPYDETPCNISPCLPVQWGATVSFWNTRESTFQNRYVHLPQRRVYWLLWLAARSISKATQDGTRGVSRFPRKSRGRTDGSRGDWRLYGLLIPLWSDLEAFLNFFTILI